MFVFEIPSLFFLFFFFFFFFFSSSFSFSSSSSGCISFLGALATQYSEG